MAQGGGYPPGPGGYGAPPGGYGAPPGGYGAPGPGGYGAPPGGQGGGPMVPAGGGPFTPQAASVLKVRSGGQGVLLAFLTCGISHLIWKWQTTDELRIASGDESLRPGLDLLLMLVTCGFWNVYSDYRNAKKAHDMLKAAGHGRSDQSTIVLLLALCGLYFVSIYILQEEYNALGRAARGERV